MLKPSYMYLHTALCTNHHIIYVYVIDPINHTQYYKVCKGVRMAETHQSSSVSGCPHLQLPCSC